MKILVVIPARGGSKGIPLKNIYSLHGKPLIGYVIESILNSKVNCHIAVSTDSEKISKVVEEYSKISIISRPNEISGDKASTESAIIHALDYMNKVKKLTFDYVITLQATSPLLKSSTIYNFIKNFEKIKDKYDAQLTLTETYADHWIKNKKGNYSRLYPDAPRNRQERNPIFIENSAIYITSVQSIRETNSVLGHKANGFIIDEIEGLDINKLNDIKLAEMYIKMKINY